MRGLQPRLLCLLRSQVIEGASKIVRDVAAWDGVNDLLVGSVLTRIPKEVAYNQAQWNCAWYLWEDGRWVTKGSKEHKTAPLDTFDIRKVFEEGTEYAFVDRDDPDWDFWNTLPAPGQRNGPAPQ